MGLVRSTTRIDQVHSLRFPLGNFQICGAHPRKECAVLLLEAAFVAGAWCGTCLVPAARSFHASAYVRVHQDGEVRLQITAQDTMKIEHDLAAELSPASLISFARICEAVAQNNLAGRHSWQNYISKMLHPRSKHERQFRFGIQAARARVQK